MNCSPPGSSNHGISQARILEWVAFPSPGDLLDPGMEPVSPALAGDSLPLSHLGIPFTWQEQDLKGQLIFETCALKTFDLTGLGWVGNTGPQAFCCLIWWPPILPWCHCGQDQDCEWQPCAQILFLQSLTRHCPPRSVAEAALPAAISTFTAEAVAAFPILSRCPQMPQWGLTLGRGDRWRKARREAHLHVAHRVLEEHQVHHRVGFIVALQGLHQRLGQKFPRLDGHVLGLPDTVCKMAIHVQALGLLHSLSEVLVTRHRGKDPPDRLLGLVPHRVETNLIRYKKIKYPVPLTWLKRQGVFVSSLPSHPWSFKGTAILFLIQKGIVYL